jgi:hypothetical protein
MVSDQLIRDADNQALDITAGGRNEAEERRRAWRSSFQPEDRRCGRAGLAKTGEEKKSRARERAETNRGGQWEDKRENVCLAFSRLILSPDDQVCAVHLGNRLAAEIARYS